MKLKSMPPCVNTDFGVGAGVAAGVAGGGWAAGAWAAGACERGVWPGSLSESADDDCAAATPVSTDAPAINTAMQLFHIELSPLHSDRKSTRLNSSHLGIS